MHVAQERDQWRTLVDRVMNLRVQKMAGDFLSSYVTISVSRMTLLLGVYYFVSNRHNFHRYPSYA